MFVACNMPKYKYTLEAKKKCNVTNIKFTQFSNTDLSVILMQRWWQELLVTSTFLNFQSILSKNKILILSVQTLASFVYLD